MAYGDGNYYKKKSGRYQVTFRGFTTTCKTEAQAKAKLNELRKAYMLEQPLAQSVMTVSEYMTQWLEERKKPYVKYDTYGTYCNIVKYPIGKTIGNIQLKALNNKHILSMQKELSKEYSHSVVAHAHSLLNEALNDAVYDELIRKNPCERVRAPRDNSVHDISVRRYTIEEAHAIIQEAKRRNNKGGCVHRYGYVIIFLLATGMRVGEALALKWSDVDLDRKIVTVRASKSDRHGTRITTTKTCKIRQIALSEMAIDALENIKQIVGDKIFVVMTSKGKHVLNVAIYQTMKRVLAAVGITEHKSLVHSLRHTAITTAMNNGAGLKHVSTMAGHSSISTTLDIYAYSDIEDQRKVSDVISDIFTEDFTS